MTRLVRASHHKRYTLQLLQLCYALYNIVSCSRGYFNVIVLYDKFTEYQPRWSLPTQTYFRSYRCLKEAANCSVRRTCPCVSTARLCGTYFSKSILLKVVFISELHTKICTSYLVSSATASFPSVKVVSQSSPVKQLLKPIQSIQAITKSVVGEGQDYFLCSRRFKIHPFQATKFYGSDTSSFSTSQKDRKFECHVMSTQGAMIYSND